MSASFDGRNDVVDARLFEYLASGEDCGVVDVQGHHLHTRASVEERK